MAAMQGGVPDITAPITGMNGALTQPWYQFFINLWNRTGGAPGTITGVLDNIGSAQGDILYRGPTQWAALVAGTAGNVLTTRGAGANPTWSAGGTGTVTSITAGSGLSGGTIMTSGTIAFQSIATGQVLANVSGSSAAPIATTPSAVLDTFGSTQGNILYRGAGTSGWQSLAASTFGQLLRTNGPTASPSWAWPFQVGVAVNAAGTSQASAISLTNDINQVTVVNSTAQGIRLDNANVGRIITVINRGSLALNIYPASGAQIDALGANVAYSLATNKVQMLFPITGTQLYSFQAG